MRIGFSSVPWFGPMSCGVILAGALAIPSTAQAAPKGGDKSDSAAADAGDDKGKSTKPKKNKKKKKNESDDDGASASVSADGATVGADGKKGAPMKGRVGVGALRTVSGLNAMYGRYYLGNRVTLGLTAGFATFSHREPDDTGEFGRTRTVGAFAIGPEVFFWPVQGPRDQQVHADFGIGGRVLTFVGFLGLPEEEQSNTLDTPIEIDLEVPAKILLFVGKRVAVSPEFGFALRIIPGDREPDGNGDFDMNPGTGIGQRLGTTSGPGVGFEVGNHAGFFMGIGVGYYFGKLPSS